MGIPEAHAPRVRFRRHRIAPDRDAEERRQIFGIAQGRADVGNTPGILAVRKNACAAIYVAWRAPFLETGWPAKFASRFASELLSTG